MKKMKKRGQSLLVKILLPLMILMICQSVIFFSATIYGGVTDTLNQNANDVLIERVNNQGNELGSRFVNKWSQFSVPVSSINQIYETISRNASTMVRDDLELQKQVLSQSVPSLIAMLRNNGATGAFLIMNDSDKYEPLGDGETQMKYGICIRDYSPDSEYSGNEDLLITRCPSSIVQSTGCAMDTWWNATYNFDSYEDNDYYYKPLEMAYNNPHADISNMSYFCGAHNFSSTDTSVISYSIPLTDSSGYPYAVLGVEMTVDYLKTLMPSSTLYGSNSGCYALVQYNEGSDEYNVIAYNGVIFQQCFGTDMKFKASEDENGMIICTENNIGESLTGKKSNIAIYNTNTPFVNEKLAMVGMVKTSSLYEISNDVRNRLLLISALVMILGLVTVSICCRMLIHPINRLSAKVRSMKVDSYVHLDRLNINEIDGLVESIEELSDKINRNQVRTEFFSRMSHDMRTPMNAIIGFSSTEMLEDATSQEMKDYLEKIHTSGEYLLGLINEVLDMTKIESDRMELKEEAICADDILGGITPIICEVANEKNVSLDVSCNDRSGMFMADKQRLCQIIMNLLSNAVKFSEPGSSVKLTIERESSDDRQVVYSFRISDSGTGMSDEFQKKMYEPFTQEKSGNGGTGLGLAIAKQMVELMGGTIECDSKLGVGTKFIIKIPFKAAADSIEGKSSARKAEPAELADINILKGKKVLLCEDHPVNAQIAGKLLERKGMIVETAVNGLEGLRIFANSNPDEFSLILMDIRMPVMDGLEASSKIRGLPRKDARKIPIVAMTANAFSEDVEKSKKAGMNEHLSKPIDSQLLYLTISGLIEKNNT